MYTKFGILLGGPVLYQVGEREIAWAGPQKSIYQRIWFL